MSHPVPTMDYEEAAVPTLTDELKEGRYPPEGGTARRLLDAMLRGEMITQMTGFHKYGTTVATQRINELEREWGWKIRRGWLDLPRGKRVRTYSL